MITGFSCLRVIDPQGHEGIQLAFESTDDRADAIFQFYDVEDVQFFLNLMATESEVTPEILMVLARDRMQITLH